MCVTQVPSPTSAGTKAPSDRGTFVVGATDDVGPATPRADSKRIPNNLDGPGTTHGAAATAVKPPRRRRRSPTVNVEKAMLAQTVSSALGPRTKTARRRPRRRHSRANLSVSAAAPTAEAATTKQGTADGAASPLRRTGSTMSVGRALRRSGQKPRRRNRASSRGGGEEKARAEAVTAAAAAATASATTGDPVDASPAVVAGHVADGGVGGADSGGGGDGDGGIEAGALPYRQDAVVPVALNRQDRSRRSRAGGGKTRSTSGFRLEPAAATDADHAVARTATLQKSPLRSKEVKKRKVKTRKKKTPELKSKPTAGASVAQPATSRTTAITTDILLRADSAAVNTGDEPQTSEASSRSVLGSTVTGVTRTNGVEPGREQQIDEEAVQPLARASAEQQTLDGAVASLDAVDFDGDTGEVPKAKVRRRRSAKGKSPQRNRVSTGSTEEGGRGAGVAPSTRKKIVKTKKKQIVSKRRTPQGAIVTRAQFQGDDEAWAALKPAKAKTRAKKIKAMTQAGDKISAANGADAVPNAVANAAPASNKKKKTKKKNMQRRSTEDGTVVTRSEFHGDDAEWAALTPVKAKTRVKKNKSKQVNATLDVAPAGKKIVQRRFTPDGAVVTRAQFEGDDAAWSVLKIAKVRKKKKMKAGAAPVKRREANAATSQ